MDHYNADLVSKSHGPVSMTPLSSCDNNVRVVQQSSPTPTTITHTRRCCTTVPTLNYNAFLEDSRSSVHDATLIMRQDSSSCYTLFPSTPTTVTHVRRCYTIVSRRRIRKVCNKPPKGPQRHHLCVDTRLSAWSTSAVQRAVNAVSTAPTAVNDQSEPLGCITPQHLGKCLPKTCDLPVLLYYDRGPWS
jgi:hypothetical protein